MKRKIIIPFLVVIGCLGLTVKSGFQTNTPQDKKLPPDVVVLGEDAKLGKVTFNHKNHFTKNYNVDGTAPMKCIKCHHVEQPATEAIKSPPHKTAYPADRTVTLTEESLKEPTTPAVTTCRSCHIRKGAEPTLLAEVPKVEDEKSGKTITLTNQNAFHRRCTECHNQVVKARPTVKPPTTMKCMTCHKRA